MDIDYDFEFLEDGDRIRPISIGLVAQADNIAHPHRAYYAVFDDGGAISAACLTNRWVTDHVFPHLPITYSGGEPASHTISWDWDRSHPEAKTIKPREQIAREVAQFITSIDQPTLWAWCGAYDHVALCQLWGRMIDKPDGIPNHTNDLQTLLDMAGMPDRGLPPQINRAHHALDDAVHQQGIRRWLHTQRLPGRWVHYSTPTSDRQKREAAMADVMERDERDG